MSFAALAKGGAGHGGDLLVPEQRFAESVCWIQARSGDGGEGVERAQRLEAGKARLAQRRSP